MDYLKLPIDFSNFTDATRFDRCSGEESIAQNIMLIITSHYGEVVGKDDFGSDIWELEFNQLVRINHWEEQVKDSLVKSISKYEKRLKNIKVKVLLSEIDDDFINNKDKHVRRKAEISVMGEMAVNDIPFNFKTIIFISPLSQ